MRNWWPDERTYAGEEHLDPTYVATYERKSGYDPTVDIAALRALGLDEDSLVLDLGTGTGVFAAAVAQCCKAVIAVDISPAMTSAVRMRAGQLGIENITVVEAGFLSYDHRGEPVDVVFTRNALHQLPDLWKAVALERIAGLLRPGGVLYLRDLVLDCEPAEIETQVEAWLAGAAGDPTVGFTAREMETHLRTEFSTYSWLLDAMLAHTGFEVLDRSFRRGAYGTYACRRNAT